MTKICLRSGSAGRSTKKISSKRPFRSSSGGSWLMSLAVATTKTGLVFSCIQVFRVANTRAVTPASVRLDDCTPESPFSISSSHRTHGDTVSAIWIARRIFSSEDPTSPAKIRPTSRRSSGRLHRWATAFAVRLLPQPWTPSSRMPRGAGRPNFCAFSVKARERFWSHPLRISRPPMSRTCSLDSKYSSTPDLRMSCCFSATIRSTSKRPLSTMHLANTFSASVSVRPSAAFSTRSRCSALSATSMPCCPRTESAARVSRPSSSRRPGRS